MLTLFRTNHLFSSIFLVFYILLLRASVFVAPFKWNPSGKGLLSQWLYNWIGYQTIGAQIVAILLLVVQGFLINYIVIKNRLSVEVNLFPGVFYVLVCCMIPDFLYLSPVLIGNTFILIAISEMFSTYKVSACADRIFNAGFWTGVAGLFYFPFLFYFIFLNSALNSLRSFNIKEWLRLSIGLLMPYLLLWMYFFATDQTDYMWQEQFANNFSFFNFGNTAANGQTYAKVAIFLLFIAIAVVNSSSYLSKRNIQAQKKISMFYWIMTSAFIGAFFQANVAFEHLISLAPALGVFLAFTFTNLKRQWAEAFHFLLVLAALIMQWVPWQL
ncbi:MAG TPA: hypothetical protein ENJ20_07125 [Bacteroidetes bacterium]|nr:hypothetical protein [Bacteroidota bacterium]